MVNRTRVEGCGYSKHDIITSVEVLFLCLLVVQNSIHLLCYSSCSGLCHLFLVSLHVVGIESECFVVYLSCKCTGRLPGIFIVPGM